MYAARPSILAETSATTLDSQYFCQNLLIAYIDDNPEDCAGWDIIWDDRGHFVEPHTDERIGIGTLAVRNYVHRQCKPLVKDAAFSDAEIETHGPEGRYGAILYIEKEGFVPILESAQLAEKFDIAIMSCKGMSVTAARYLIDETCGDANIPLFVLHDFDIAGFTIAKTLCSNTRRYLFRNRLKVVDLGLRLEDVEQLRLQGEFVSIGKNLEKLANTLERNGATTSEIEFLLDRQRVELNALMSMSL